MIVITKNATTTSRVGMCHECGAYDDNREITQILIHTGSVTTELRYCAAHLSEFITAINTTLSEAPADDTPTLPVNSRAPEAETDRPLWNEPTPEEVAEFWSDENADERADVIREARYGKQL